MTYVNAVIFRAEKRGYWMVVERNSFYVQTIMKIRQINHSAIFYLVYLRIFLIYFL